VLPEIAIPLSKLAGMQRGLRQAASKLAVASNYSGSYGATGLLSDSSACPGSPPEIVSHSFLLPDSDLKAGTHPCGTASTFPSAAHIKMAAASATGSMAGPTFGMRAAVRGSAPAPPVAQPAGPGHIQCRANPQAWGRPTYASCVGHQMSRTPWSAASSVSSAVGAAQAALKHCKRSARGKSTLAAPMVDGPLSEGSMVGFSTPSSQGLALLTGRQGSSWQAIDQRGLEVLLHAKDVVLKLPGRGYDAADCGRLYSAASSPNLPHAEPIWRELLEKKSPVYVEDLAAQLFGDTSASSLWQAFRFATCNRMYFKQVGRKPPVFQPRDAAAVVHRQEVSNARKAREDQLAAWTACYTDAATLEPGERLSLDMLLTAPYVEILNALKAYCCLRETEEQRQLASEALSWVGQYSHPDSAAEVLAQVGFVPPYGTFALERSGLPTVFPQECLSRAESVAASADEDLDEHIRRDFRSHKLFTIDDESTTEIDDGLSVEWLPDGRHRVWVHIADPTRWLEVGDALEQVLRQFKLLLALSWLLAPPVVWQAAFMICVF